MMFGYASNETEQYLPLALMFAHKLTKKLTEVRKQGILKYLGPDGKAQVTIEYENNIPKRVHTVVVSSQHDAYIDMDTLRKDIKEQVIEVVIDKELLDENTIYYINPTGRFVIGGPLRRYRPYR